MFAKLFLVFVALSFSISDVLGRERWLERDGRAVVGRFTRRRFGQESPAVVQKIGAACPGQVCGVLGGAAITPLLAAQPECSQQDHADRIIDESKQFDAATQALMLQLAIEYRQVEKNTPPDFTTNPPTPRNSMFCQKAPKNPELNGLVQAQDPANGDIFFDPASKASVKRGAQPNTTPFGGAAAPLPPAETAAAESSSAVETSSAVESSAAEASAAIETTAVVSETTATPTATGCVTEVTVTVTPAIETSADVCPTAVTVTVTPNAAPTATDAASSVTTSSAPAPAPTGNAGAIGDFGKCTIPEIEFAAGFDNRRETSFQPVDRTSYTHGSAQNIDIITRAMCDQLVNTCGADQVAKDTCAKATAAASAAAKKTGAQADAFNAVFGITTNFAAVQPLSDQGTPI